MDLFFKIKSSNKAQKSDFDSRKGESNDSSFSPETKE